MHHVLSCKSDPPELVRCVTADNSSGVTEKLSTFVKVVS
jgi:hypothetical protein